jgi:anti-sigma factor RsiW
MNTLFDDTTLSAWLDGELPAEQRPAVEAWLRDHPEDAARVRLWAADGEALRVQPGFSAPPWRTASMCRRCAMRWR